MTGANHMQMTADGQRMAETFGPVESDPHGLSAHTPGAKLDAGKPMPGLVLGGFARALLAVTDVGTYGARKYTPHGWLSVPNGIDRYTDAMHRHLLREAAGEAHDPDTELMHAAHAAWNALARLDLMIRQSEQALMAASTLRCWCHTCRPVTVDDMRMVLCPTCGCKRCPHANDHRNACTGSNAPGQPGSAYPSINFNASSSERA